MTEASPALQALGEAVQEFVNATSDEPLMLSQAIVIYEVVTFDGNGDPTRAIDYACPTDNFSISGGLGLVDAGRFYVRRDILGARSDDEDDD